MRAFGIIRSTMRLLFTCLVICLAVTSAFCATINDSWGYKPTDQNWKSAETIRANREHLKSIGANYLLNVGPDGLGRIPARSVDILLEAKA